MSQDRQPTESSAMDARLTNSTEPDAMDPRPEDTSEPEAMDARLASLPESLDTRLAGLSESKRRLLARRLERVVSPSSTPRARTALTAFVEPAPTAASDDLAAQIRAALSHQLPEYMIPSTFVMLERLPRTASGKIDRSALRRLPAAPPRAQDTGSEPDSPRSDLEAILTKIWNDVLGIDAIGRDENFFELGGDSILSIRVIARARDAGLAITPKQFHDSPTIAELASLAARAREEEEASLAARDREKGAAVPNAQRDTSGAAPDFTADSTAQSSAEPSADSSGEMPLTPIQHWFFEYVTEDPHHWNQAMLLEIPSELDGAKVRDALESLNGLDAFRLQFERSPHNQSGSPNRARAEPGTEWRQTLAVGRAAIPLELIDLSDLGGDARDARIEEIEARFHRSFDLAKAPLARAAFFRCGNLPGRLLLVVHHLIVDGISWSVLLDQLERRLTTGAALPEEPVPFPQWARHLCAHVDLVDDEGEYWLGGSSLHPPLAGGSSSPSRSPLASNSSSPSRSLLASGSSSMPIAPLAGGGSKTPDFSVASSFPRIPTDLSDDRNANTRGDAGAVVMSLDPDRTQSILREVPESYRTQVNDVLLCALVTAFAEWSGSPSLGISLEGHGRHPLSGDLDLSRSVGWFTTVYPVWLEIDLASDAGDRLKSIKEQLRRVPRHGLGHGMLRYLSPDASIRAALRNRPDPDVMFNYLGQRIRSGSVLRRIRDAGPGARSPRALRPCWIEIDSFVEEGRFQAVWTYGTRIHRRETIESLAESFRAALAGIVRHCEQGHAGATPSDFPLAGLGQAELDRIAKMLGGGGE